MKHFVKQMIKCFIESDNGIKKETPAGYPA